jgi:protein tyrosine/serine phosphatase
MKNPMALQHHPDEPGYGSLKSKSNPGLLIEWRYWDGKIKSKSNWDAAVAAANEFRTDAEREIKRRGMEIPK